MNRIPDDFSIQQAMQFAQTPAGKAAIAYLQNKLGKDSQSIAGGDLSAIQDQLQRLMDDPEFRKIMQVKPNE